MAVCGKGCSRRKLLVLGLLTLLVLPACTETPYYWQAARGQWEIVHNQRSLEIVLLDPRVDAITKHKLRLIQDAQTFARQHLAYPPDVKAYQTYTDLGRPVVTWLVVAAPAFSLEPDPQCFLIAGCFDYRGFFQREAAQAYAAKLAHQGLDVLVRPVKAYSTLGWLRDPVLNTMLKRPDWDLAGLVFHEQAHQVLFVRGDTEFNESLATFLETEGVSRYLAAKQDTAQQAQFLAYQADEQRFMAIVHRGEIRLKALYDSNLPEAQKLAQKNRIFAEMAQDYQAQRQNFTLENYDWWFTGMNNAHLAELADYTRREGAFRALFNHNGQDFARFWPAVRQLADLDEAQRTQALDQLDPLALQPPPPELLHAR